MAESVADKVTEFRARAQKSKLLAAVTSERTPKKIYEDAARQWEQLAENYETKGRPY